MSSKERERFKRVATRRYHRVVEAIQMLRKCANREAYSYSAEEGQQIVDRLQDEVNALKAAFMRGGEPRFTLREKGAPERSSEPPSALS